jgi:hypothetical protein
MEAEESHFNYDKFTALLHYLGFVAENITEDSIEFQLLTDFWKILEGEAKEGIAVKNIRYFSKCIMGLHKEFKARAQSPRSEQGQSNIGNFDPIGTFSVNGNESRRLFVKFKPMYVNRMHFIGRARKEGTKQNLLGAIAAETTFEP